MRTRPRTPVEVWNDFDMAQRCLALGILALLAAIGVSYFVLTLHDFLIGVIATLVICAVILLFIGAVNS